MITKLLRVIDRAPLLLAAILVGAVTGMAGLAMAQPAPQSSAPQASSGRSAVGQGAQPAQRAGQQRLRFGGNPGYVAYSFLRVDGVNGDWRGSQYRSWIRAEAHYWRSADGDMYGGFSRRDIVFPLPGAPRSGEGAVTVSLNKDNMALAALMERCHSGVPLGDIGYAVSAERSNRAGLRVPRPENVPEYFEFNLRNARISACPTADGAPEQALVIEFSDIDWLNWEDRDIRALPVTLQPAELLPLPRNLTGETRAWVMTWFALAHDVSADQCPIMNEKPVEEDYYRLVPPEEAAREREQLASQGGVSYENGLMSLRGPGRLDAILLPGIVPDPGQREPQTATARGVNLDGDAGNRRHRDFLSEDGRITGIDNQLYRVMGCNMGWSGHTGFLFQYMNEGMRNGMMSILLRVDGIDNEQNDREVYVTMLTSLDDMAKNAAGTAILGDFTFRVAEDPQYSHYFERVRGRIVNGAIITDSVPYFRMNAGQLQSPTPPGAHLENARMHIQIMPDRTIRGVLAGYADWREIPSMISSSIAEFSFGYQAPALYNSLRRNADGLRNPMTGENDGISAAYDMEGVPAFIASPSPSVAGVTSPGGGGS